MTRSAVTSTVVDPMITIVQRTTWPKRVCAEPIASWSMRATRREAAKGTTTATMRMATEVPRRVAQRWASASTAWVAAEPPVAETSPGGMPRQSAEMSRSAAVGYRWGVTVIRRSASLQFPARSQMR